jgi:membrane dipeptidase
MGRQAIYQLNKNKIIIDVSHLSDGGVKDVLKLSSSPIVASHSAAAGVVNVSRNLTDEQIKAISDGGGVVGVNFCPTFVGASNMDGAVQNVLRLIDVGGEDVVAIGSDFDGMRRVGRVKDCTAIMLFFKKLAAKGVPPRVIEKVAIKNFLRLFYDVVG